MIPYAKGLIEDDDRAAVDAVLRSGRVAQGPLVPQFEAALASYAGARHAVCVSSGTAALWCAYMATDLRGDGLPLDVGMPAVTFVATANALSVGTALDAYGAATQPSPFPIDVDPLAWCGLAEGAHRDPSWAPRPLYVQVTIGGYPAPPHGAKIVDAAHGPYRKGPELMRCLSFHPAKNMTTGEGGAVLTDDDDVAERLRRRRDNGRDMPHDPVPRIAGLNLRMGEMNAALGLSQLRKLDGWQARRRKIADYYRERLGGIEGLRFQADHVDHFYHLFIVHVDQAHRPRDMVRIMLGDRGVGAQVHYQPLYRLPPYQADPARFPNAEAYWRGALSIPMSHALTDAEVEQVVKSVREVLA